MAAPEASRPLNRRNDGATDAKGRFWFGTMRNNIAPDGAIDRIVKAPASRVACCAFGGDQLDALYITTSRLHLTKEQLASQPQAGGAFALKPGASGIPRAAFAG